MIANGMNETFHCQKHVTTYFSLFVYMFFIYKLIYYIMGLFFFPYDLLDL